MSSTSATSAISFTGLASGMDTQSIIDKLVSLKEAQLVTPIDNKIDAVKSKKDTLAPILSAFDTLRLAALDLKSATNAAWNVKSGTSSDTDKMTVGAINASTAINGTYSLSNISQLAQADKVIFNGVADKTSTTFGTGTFTITYKGETTSVTIDSTNNTLNGIVGAINSADAGVTASIINDGSGSPYRLILTANDTGSDTSITHTIDSTLSLTVDAAASTTAENEAANASFKVNGVTLTSTSNTISEAITGVTFSLLKTETTDSISLTVKQDTETILANITSFTDAYTTIRQEMATALTPDEDGNLGPLAHDSDLQAAYNDLNGFFTKVVGGLGAYTYNSLSQIGITTSLDGEVEVDSSKLSSILDASLENIRLMFQGSDTYPGIAREIYDYLYDVTTPSSTGDTSGLFYKKNLAFTTITSQLEETKTSREAQVEAYKTRITSKFNNMELVISQLKVMEQQLQSFAAIYASDTNKLL